MEKMEAYLVRWHFDYNETTGNLYWKIPGTRNAKMGQIVGNKSPLGYIQLYCRGEAFLAHRVVWAYMTGEWPKEKIDHKDGVRDNNRWENLRECTQSQNLENSKDKPNKTGYRGVSSNGKGKFNAKITVNKKTIWLGIFDTPEEASEAYKKARDQHHQYYIDRF